MTTLWKITGCYEWTEERHFNCVAYIDAEVEADTKDAAIEKAIKAIDGDPDEDDCIYTDRSAWKHGDKRAIKATMTETDNEELRRKEEERQNIEYMKMYSTPLYTEVQP